MFESPIEIWALKPECDPELEESWLKVLADGEAKAKVLTALAEDTQAVLTFEDCKKTFYPGWEVRNFSADQAGKITGVFVPVIDPRATEMAIDKIIWRQKKHRLQNRHQMAQYAYEDVLTTASPYVDLAAVAAAIDETFGQGTAQKWKETAR